MIAFNGLRSPALATPPDLPGISLPHAAVLERIAYVASAEAGQVVMEFPNPIGRRAVLIGADSKPGMQADLLVASVVSEGGEDLELLNKLRDWVEVANPNGSPRSQTITLYGTQIVWAPGRVAIVAQSDRLESVRRALIEVLYYEAELRDIENDLNGRWSLLEADAPLAFEFDEKAVRKRSQLAQRFQQILGLRARLARVTPHVLCPHVHPPTLASQVGERLRERTRMPQRLEFLGEQVEVFEGVYESCGQRASDFMLSRSSNTLEWVIIVLLGVQLLFSAFEAMATTTTGK
ncbi:MAG: hypothetical protein C0467_28475 [Planctomycetaceae bacterium]|nr:hypothetical protein [Planctomycetaceae bacterium]